MLGNVNEKALTEAVDRQKRSVKVLVGWWVGWSVGSVGWSVGNLVRSVLDWWYGGRVGGQTAD